MDGVVVARVLMGRSGGGGGGAGAWPAVEGPAVVSGVVKGLMGAVARSKRRRAWWEDKSGKLG